METDMSVELELLANLKAELTEHGIQSDLREDINGLDVKTGTPDVSLWVFVSFTGRFFSWNRGVHQHPVRDVPGTARRIATHIEGFELLGGGE
jgi:hypothetical protein